MKRKTRVIIITSSVISIVVVTILVRMFTFPTDIDLVKTIKIPALPELSALEPGDHRAKAVSLDGKIIQGTNASPQPTASTAKMILGLAIMKEKPFSLGTTGEDITITPEFYNRYLWYKSHNGSNTRVKIGETISQYDALVSIFLASSNNMADTLAIWAFGSIENYQKYATNLLQEMGIKDTTIGIDASGYSETTTSTAEDLAKIATEVLKNPVLKEIVGLKSHDIPVAGTLKNTNQILGESLNHNSIVIGVKTGYIGDISGYNLISAYEIDGHTVTLALLGASTRQSSFDESRKELLKLSSEIIPTTIVESGDTVGYFETWWNGKHKIHTTEGISVVAVRGDSPTVTLTEDKVKITLDREEYTATTEHDDFTHLPTFWERLLHVFGWQYE